MTLGDEIPAWAQSCPSGKRKFTSSKDARYQAKGGKTGGIRGTVHPYKCLQCDAYHLTSTARRNDGRKHGSTG